MDQNSENIMNYDIPASWNNNTIKIDGTGNSRYSVSTENNFSNKYALPEKQNF